jgi:hypothetical protein
MSTPSGGSKGPEGPAGPIAATHARSRSVARGKPERRRALITSCGMLLVGAVAAVVIITAKTPKAVQASNSPTTAPGGPDGDVRTAKITRASDGNGCSQEIFDNQTGRMNRSSQPCEATVYDSHGTPVPVGTIHRLDAISKSFAGH